MKKTVYTAKRAAFTLVELIIVIAIITLLAGIVVVTINPANIFANSRNGQRANDVSTIQSAISRYLADSPATGGTARTLLGTSGCTNCAISNGQSAYTVTGGNVTATGLAGNAAGKGVYGTGTPTAKCSGGSAGTFTSVTGYDVLATGTGGDTGGVGSNGSIDLSNLVSLGYLPKVPVDPSTGNPYKICIDYTTPTYSETGGTGWTQSGNTAAYVGATGATGTTGTVSACTNCISSPGKLVIFAPSAEAVNGSTSIPYAVI